MPLEQVEKVNEQTVIALWRLDESTEELASLNHLNFDEELILNEFVNENRKKQWLAYRALLKGLFNNRQLVISYDLNHKPFLANQQYHLSVSHSCHYAVVILSDKYAVGIDIEKVSDRIKKIVNKFLNETELGYAGSGNSLEELFIYWGAKESLYKLYGKKNLDFRKNIILDKVTMGPSGKFLGKIILGDKEMTFTIYFKIMHGYVMVYALDEYNNL